MTTFIITQKLYEFLIYKYIADVLIRGKVFHLAPSVLKDDWHVPMLLRDIEDRCRRTGCQNDSKGVFDLAMEQCLSDCYRVWTQVTRRSWPISWKVLRMAIIHFLFEHVLQIRSIWSANYTKRNKFSIIDFD